MAKAKTAIVVIVILVLLQISWITAHKHEDKDKDKHDHNHNHNHKNGGGTPAVMTVNGFQKGGDGGGPSECDGKFHSNGDLIVALSTRWYAGGKRCHKKISITSQDNRRTVEAQVVDECDSRHGCKTNIVDASAAVWKKLGLDTKVGEVHVTWSDA